MVSFNYRRVPAVTLAKQLIDEGRLGASSTTGRISCRTGRSRRRSAAGRHGHSGGWTSRRPARGVTGDLLAHCIDTAIWLNGRINTVTRHDRDVRQGAQAHVETGKVEQVGIDDACAFLCRFENGSLGDVRIHPLRPRAQGPLHVRDQRRERLDRLGPARPAPAAATSTTATSPSSAAGGRSTSPTATCRTWALVGAGPADRLRAQLRPPGGRLPGERGQGAADVADLPRRPGDAVGLRRGAGFGEEGCMGKREIVKTEMGRIGRMGPIGPIRPISPIIQGKEIESCP